MVGPSRLSATLSELIKDEEAQSVFEQIIKSKKIRYRNLQKRLGMEEEGLDRAIAKLEKADLIGVVGTGQKEFQTFYPLAAGLTAERLMAEMRHE